MIRYSSEVTIARPPHAVYEALLDSDRYPQWTDMVDVSFDGADTPRVGMRGRFRLAKGPIKGMLEMELTELDPDRRIVFRGHAPEPRLDGGLDARGRRGPGHASPTPGSSGMHGWRRLLEPLAGREVRERRGGRGGPAEGAPGGRDPYPVSAGSMARDEDRRARATGRRLDRHRPLLRAVGLAAARGAAGQRLSRLRRGGRRAPAAAHRAAPARCAARRRRAYRRLVPLRVTARTRPASCRTLIGHRRAEVAERIAGLQALDARLAALERHLVRPGRALAMLGGPSAACCDAAGAVVGSADGACSCCAPGG